MTKSYNVGIIGMGYVGLTLAIAFAQRGVNVTGVEVRQDILDSIKSGKAHFKELGIDEALQKCIRNGSLSFAERLASNQYDYCVMTVGTPLNAEGQVSFESLERAISGLPDFGEASEFTMILRSTVAVGTSRALLDKLKAKGIQNVVFAPERTIEGNALNELYTLPQIIGANNQIAMSKGELIFSIITQKIIKVSSLEIAELAKLFNNTYRDITFAVGNYFALVAQQYGSNGIEAIAAANQDYLRGGIPKPGFVGGPCLEKDPYILSYKKYASTEIKLLDEFNFTMMSRTFNELLVEKFCHYIERHCNGSPIILSGIAFKGRPATSDLRGSMGIRLLHKIKEKCAVQGLHDFEAFKSEVVSETGLDLQDLPDKGSGLCLVIANNHTSYEHVTVECLESFDLIIDIQGALTLYQSSRLTNFIDFGSIAI